MRVQVVIIGGGPAGISAAIWCKRLNIDYLLLEANLELGGQLHSIHNPIIDYPGLITQNGKQFTAALKEHIMSLGCSVQLGAEVISLDPDSKEIVYRVNNKQITIAADYIILAAGVKPRKLYVPGEQEMIDRGEIYSATKDAANFAGKTVAVVGGGDRAFEGALLFAKHCKNVVLISRSSQFRARQQFVSSVLDQPNIQTLIGYTVDEIHGDGKVEELSVREIKTGKLMAVPVEAVLIRVGVEPNISLLRGKVELNHEGYIVIDAFGQTSLPGVFAIGDICTAPAVTSLVHAMSQGMVAVKHIQTTFLSR